MKRVGGFLAVLLLATFFTGCIIDFEPDPPITHRGWVRGFVYARQGAGPLAVGGEDILFTAEPLASSDGYVPLVGALVEVRNDITGRRRSDQTEYDGYFEVRDLDQGYSYLTVNHQSLRSEVKRVVYVRGDGSPTWVGTIYTETNPYYYFVIVGIENYRDRQLSFPGPEKDAHRMYDTLYLQNRFPREATRLLNGQATKVAIRNAIQKYVDKAQSSSDHLVIYFSGFTGADYLAPYEFNGDWSTAITDADLESWVRYFPGHVTVIVDGSYSQTMADGNPFRPLALKKPKYTVLTGALEHQQVNFAEDLGGSVFTFYLWEGLEYRYADLNRDGYITASELYSYSKTEMEWFYRDKPAAIRHQPFLYEGVSGDTVLFRY